MDERFSIIREPEYEALKSLSANACKALVAIKFGQRDGVDISFGVRDLEAFGMKKSAAATAFKELTDAGLITVQCDSSFGAKRKKRVWRVVHTRAEKPELQSATADTGRRDSPPQRTMPRPTVRQSGQVVDLQSARADTTRRLPSTSSQEVEGEGSRQQASVNPALRDQLNVSKKAAGALSLSEQACWDLAGSPSAFGEMAWEWERGEISTSQLRAKLADGDDGSGRAPPGTPYVASVAIGGAC